MARLHPSFLRARRESLHILGAWLVCLVWTVGYCALFAYSSEPATLIWGFPSWVLFGVAIPWVAATVFSLWYALARIEDTEE